MQHSGVLGCNPTQHQSALQQVQQPFAMTLLGYYTLNLSGTGRLAANDSKRCIRITRRTVPERVQLLICNAFDTPVDASIVLYEAGNNGEGTDAQKVVVDLEETVAAIKEYLENEEDPIFLRGVCTDLTVDYIRASGEAVAGAVAGASTHTTPAGPTAHSRSTSEPGGSKKPRAHEAWVGDMDCTWPYHIPRYASTTVCCGMVQASTTVCMLLLVGAKTRLIRTSALHAMQSQCSR